MRGTTLHRPESASHLSFLLRTFANFQTTADAYYLARFAIGLDVDEVEMNALHAGMTMIRVGSLDSRDVERVNAR